MDASLLLLQKLDRNRFRVVGLQQFLAFVLEPFPPQELFLGNGFGFSPLLLDGGLDEASDGPSKLGSHLDLAVFLFHLLFDAVDSDNWLRTLRASRLFPEAEKIRVAGAVAVGDVHQGQP
ncbi:MAG TPA: hypothetical protein VGB64_05540 [Actinomycetota bacterium]